MTKLDRISGEDSELNRLLARGRLSGAEYDAVEQRIFEAITPRRARAKWPFVGSALALAAGLALWLGLGSAPSHYGEKGGSTPAGGVVGLGCPGAAPHTCRLGDTLLFSVLGNTAPVYVVAYAERLDASEPSRIWYFPHADGTAPRVEVAAGTNVAREGVRLGPPHVKGRYRVKVWLSDAPVERERAAKLTEPAQSFDIDVVD
jgi:hypothetical protein